MTGKRRLCIMVTSPITATTFLKGYLRFLQNDAWEVTLICADGDGLRQFAEREGTRLRPLAMKREPSPWSDIRSVLTAYRLLRQLQPDVLVYATPKASLVGAVAGALARVPVRVYELWGLRLETSVGLAQRVFQSLEALTARLSTLVIANSRSLAARAVELGVSGGRDIVVLGHGSSHGVDSSFFSPKASMPDPDLEMQTAVRENGTPVVGFVGRLHPDKGIDTLVEALGICVSRGLKFQLLVVGGDEGADLSQLLEPLQAEIPVHVVGHIPDPRPYLRMMDLLVLPSKREGFPNVVLEAASMEVPAVVSDATGCVDSVVADETGVIEPVGDASSFAAAITRLVEDALLRAEMGSAARQRAMAHFSPPDVWALHSARWRSTGLEQ